MDDSNKSENDQYDHVPITGRRRSTLVVDLNKNLGAKIQNPLAHFSLGELMTDVEEFATEYHLTDILPELRKGALVARDPANFQTLKELDEEEKRILAREVTHKWSQPRTLYFTIITCSIGAAVQGWDQTGSNGANLSFPNAFGIGNGDTPGAPNQDRDNWLVGIVNAAPYIASAFVGC